MPCSSQRLPESAIYEAFSRMVFKLWDYREELLAPLIHDMAVAQRKGNAKCQQIAQIDREIADLAARNLVVVRLHNAGILNASYYAAQTAGINGKIRTLRSERKRLLEEVEEDTVLEQIRELNTILTEYQPTCDFDEDLYAQIVERTTVLCRTALQFQLIGGITLMENIGRQEVNAE